MAERTQPGQRQTVEEEGYMIHAFAKTDGLTGIAVANKAYDKFVAHKLLSDIVDLVSTKYPKSTWSKATAPLPVAELQGKFDQFKNSDSVQGISKIQRELEDTKIVLHKTIENVLERGKHQILMSQVIISTNERPGEKLDNLVAKSDGLSAQSRAFYTSAKKQNSCCAVM